MSDNTDTPRRGNGGPAFPRPAVYNPDTGGALSCGYEGMTLRDWFAGQALMGRLAAERHRTDEDGVLGYPELAEEAYGLADAMLKAREK